MEEIFTDFIQEYMNIGVDTFEDADAIFKLSTKYFQIIKESEYDPENTTLSEGLIDKMITISNNFELEETLIKELEGASRSFISAISQSNVNKSSKTHTFNKMFSVSMKFHNAMVKIKPKNDYVFGPFQPDKSDKTLITLKISEAIEIIRDSEILTEKVKNKLTEMLNSVISELNKPKTNWNIYFKNIGYTIMFLGTLGSIANGAAGIQQIIKSQEKLKEANNEVQKTSVNVSRKDIKDVFIINENVKINTTETLKIENTKKKEKK